MKILIADDDPLWQRLAQVTLTRAGYEVSLVSNGHAAWDVLQQPDAPLLALLDWMMPGMDGIEVCRRLRQLPPSPLIYVILLTALDEEEAVAQAVEAGADDYLIKPFLPEHLRLRVRIGMRVLGLEAARQRCLQELADVHAQLDRVHQLLPLCPQCGRRRRSRRYWRQIEAYVREQPKEQIAPSLCPRCPHDVGGHEGMAGAVAGDHLHTTMKESEP